MTHRQLANQATFVWPNQSLTQRTCCWLWTHALWPAGQPASGSQFERYLYPLLALNVVVGALQFAAAARLARLKLAERASYCLPTGPAEIEGSSALATHLSPASSSFQFQVNESSAARLVMSKPSQTVVALALSLALSLTRNCTSRPTRLKQFPARLLLYGRQTGGGRGGEQR